MHQYFIKTPWVAKKIFPSYQWSLPGDEKAVYLTFDDGPHPDITPWVLEELKKYEAKASFFCIGNNVKNYPEVYRRILDEGHAVGNHTYHHLNGWKSNTKNYLDDVSQAAAIIKSNLFRPPYGKIKSRQAKKIESILGAGRTRIIMWDVLSADFDTSCSPQQCCNNVLDHTEAGSIIVFHDSEKAFTNLQYALPRVLAALREKGMQFRKIEL